MLPRYKAVEPAMSDHDCCLKATVYDDLDKEVVAHCYSVTEAKWLAKVLNATASDKPGLDIDQVSKGLDAMLGTSTPKAEAPDAGMDAVEAQFKEGYEALRKPMNPLMMILPPSKAIPLQSAQNMSHAGQLITAKVIKMYLAASIERHARLAKEALTVMKNDDAHTVANNPELVASVEVSAIVMETMSHLIQRLEPSDPVSVDIRRRFDGEAAYVTLSAMAQLESLRAAGFRIVKES